ncbi:MAG: hypothetical protein ACYC9O_13580 [Candidatus Latescibacterota bacterium]
MAIRFASVLLLMGMVIPLGCDDNRSPTEPFLQPGEVSVTGDLALETVFDGQSVSHDADDNITAIFLSCSESGVEVSLKLNDRKAQIYRCDCYSGSSMYYRKGGALYGSVYDNASAEISIAVFDSIKIEGTFSGALFNTRGGSITIAGKFSVPGVK